MNYIHPDLYGFQKTGAWWLASGGEPQSRNLLLADEMGIGKSAQAIAGADLLQITHILVLCPGIGRDNWKREFEKWQMIPRSTCVIKKSSQKVEGDVVIASYQATMSRDILVQLTEQRWDLIICDEAHLLKNPKALTTIIMYGADYDCTKGLGSKADRIWLLTGTPFPNGPHEVWTHCHALFPESVKNLETYSRWVNRFCYWRESNGEYHVLNSQNEGELINRIQPYIKRRVVADVMPDLPPLRWGHVVVSPDSVPKMPDSALEADTVIRAAIASLKRDPTPEEVASIINAESMHISSLLKWTGIAKAPAVAEAISTDLENGLQKLIVFAMHSEVFEILLKGIPGSVAIVGKTPEKKRQYLLDAFQGLIPGYNPPVILLHKDIASTTLTLTAACDVAHAETGWVVKDILQATKRCHRIGQTRPVLAKIYSLSGSLDEAVSDTIVRKQRLVSRIETRLTTK